MESFPLKSPLYDSFFQIYADIFHEAEKHPKGKLAKHIEDYQEWMDVAEKILNIGDDERMGRIAHETVIHFDGGYCQKKMYDHMPMIRELRTVRMFTFEIKRHEIETTTVHCFQDDTDYTIDQEYAGSEKSYLELPLGTIVTCHAFIRENGRMSVMKNFFYLQDTNPVKQVGFALMLADSVDTVELLRNTLEGFRIDYESYAADSLNQSQLIGPDVNYLKRIKHIFIDACGKKFHFNPLEKLLKDTSQSWGDISSLWQREFHGKKIDFRALEVAFIGYRNQLALKQSSLSNPEKDAQYIKAVCFHLFHEQSRRSGRDFADFSDKQNTELYHTWCRTPQTLLGDTTPEKFIQRYDAGFHATDILFSSMTDQELEFYTGYAKKLTKKEYEEYRKAIKYAHAGDFKKAAAINTQLYRKHPKFVRVIFNFLATRINWYIKIGKGQKYIMSDQEGKDLVDFIEKYDDRIAEIKKIDPNYPPLTPQYEQVMNNQMEYVTMLLLTHLSKSILCKKKSVKKSLHSGRSWQ